MLPWRSTAMLCSAVNCPAWRPGRPKRASVALRGAVDDAHLAVHAVDHVDEFLLRVGREHEVVDRAGAARVLLEDVLGDERAVLPENLQPVVGAVADVDEAVLGDADAMHRVAELLRGRLGRIVGRRLVVARPVAVGAPVPLVGAGLRIEHHDAAIGIAVGGEHFLRGNIHRDIGRRAEPLGGIAVVALALLADLQHELAVHGELEELAVLLAVAGEPDEIVVVDEDAVLALGPFVAAPGPPQWRRRLPDWSNTSTGGAATQHLASGGFCSAARSRGVSEAGRCTTQMRSKRSVAMPETWPRIQLFGSGFGQNASTWNCGTLSSAATGVVHASASSPAAILRAIAIICPPVCLPERDRLACALIRLRRAGKGAQRRARRKACGHASLCPPYQLSPWFPAFRGNERRMF